MPPSTYIASIVVGLYQLNLIVVATIKNALEELKNWGLHIIVGGRLSDVLQRII